MKGISCILPAAGFSRRCSSGNKLLERLPNGLPVVRQVALTLLEGGLRDVTVVTGHQASVVEAALRGLAVRCVFAVQHAEGMGASLAAGVRACSPAAEAFLVCPADLPWLQAATVREVCAAFASQGGRRHIIPMQGGRRGHPVVLGAWLRPGLECLTGEQGARGLLVADGERERCHELCVSDEGIHRDVDAGLSRGESRSP